MRIFVDADACPVVGITEQAARQYGIPVTLLCDTKDVYKRQQLYQSFLCMGRGRICPVYAAARPGIF